MHVEIRTHECLGHCRQKRKKSSLGTRMAFLEATQVREGRDAYSFENTPDLDLRRWTQGHREGKKLGTKTTTTHVANWRCSTDSLPQRSTLQCQLLPVHLVSNGFGEDLRWRGGGFQLNFGMPLQLACPCRLTKGTNILERKWTGSLPTCAGIQPRSIICMLSASILPLRGPRNNCLSSPCGSTVCSCRWIRATVSVFRAA